MSNHDIVVTGIEVNQGIQVQETRSTRGAFRGISSYRRTTETKAEEACSAAFVKTLMFTSVCATLPSLPARDMTELVSASVHYRVDESARLAAVALGPSLLPVSQKSGVALVAGRPMVVRVFASLVGSAAGKSVPAG